MFRSIEIESAIANSRSQTNQNMYIMGNGASLRADIGFLSAPIVSVQSTQPRDLTISSGHEMDIHTDKYDIHIDASGNVSVDTKVVNSKAGGVYDV